eukprot:gnl/MRDRNA2_/MRDRNA2_36353_c0_seq1.p1 gnl/MRDRNA2_/MRDRNA2_36353_c0~~gnl/MRDRNA2_/MRDRNA2_36353_c0_seq1.p1  ORF type:complete len:581 (-),score=99.87 gnl/MRDRNA2_/MRDRNA2_36353_c0_seq1:36-1703(-)
MSSTYVWGDSHNRSRSRDRSKSTSRGKDRSRDQRRKDSSTERKRDVQVPLAPIKIDIAAEAAKAAASLTNGRGRSRSQSSSSTSSLEDEIRAQKRRLYNPPQFGSSGWDNTEADPRGLIHPGYKNVPGMPTELNERTNVVEVPRSEPGPALMPTIADTQQSSSTVPSGRPVQGFASDKSTTGVSNAMLGIETLSPTGFVGASPGSAVDAPIGGSKAVFDSIPVLGQRPKSVRPQSFYELTSNMTSSATVSQMGSVGQTGGSAAIRDLPSLPGAEKVQTSSFTLATMPPNSGKGKGKGRWDGGKSNWECKDGLGAGWSGGGPAGGKGNSGGNWGGNKGSFASGAGGWGGTPTQNLSLPGLQGPGSFGTDGVPSQYPPLAGVKGAGNAGAGGAPSQYPPLPGLHGAGIQGNVGGGGAPWQYPPLPGGQGTGAMPPAAPGSGSDQSNPNVYIELNQGLKQFGSGGSVTSNSLRESTASQQALLAAQRANKLIPCKDFNVGKCARGAACPFMHHLKVNNSSYKTKMCQFYKQGEICMNGLMCSWAHSEAELIPQYKQIR